MLQKQDLVDNFADPEDISPNIVRCQLQLPRSTFYYYTRLSSSESKKGNFLVVSENKLDDDFACLILDSVPDLDPPSSLTAVALLSNKYGFSTVLLAPKDYHAYFKGILDDKRDYLILCLPVHYCEFSGDETANEFMIMRREVVPSLDWDRSVCPKIVFRFNNPKTQGGTGNAKVRAKYDLVLREIDNLSGVAQGFIEISNYQHCTIEILSPEVGRYMLIRESNDQNKEGVDKDLLLKMLWEFLTEK